MENRQQQLLKDNDKESNNNETLLSSKFSKTPDHQTIFPKSPNSKPIMTSKSPNLFMKKSRNDSNKTEQKPKLDKNLQVSYESIDGGGNFEECEVVVKNPKKTEKAKQKADALVTMYQRTSSRLEEISEKTSEN